MTEKKMTKISKALGGDIMKEMQALPPEDLKAMIVQANASIKQVNEELEALPEYVQVCEDKSDLESGKKAVEKLQNARIQYALHLLSGDVLG